MDNLLEGEKDLNEEFIDGEQIKSSKQEELSSVEKYLLSNAHWRRIWLSIKDPKGIILKLIIFYQSIVCFFFVFILFMI